MSGDGGCIPSYCRFISQHALSAQIPASQQPQVSMGHSFLLLISFFFLFPGGNGGLLRVEPLEHLAQI